VSKLTPGLLHGQNSAGLWCTAIAIPVANLEFNWRRGTARLWRPNVVVNLCPSAGRNFSMWILKNQLIIFQNFLKGPGARKWCRLSDLFYWKICMNLLHIWLSSMY